MDYIRKADRVIRNLIQGGGIESLFYFHLVIME